VRQFVPQATLYGSDGVGGAVNIITKKRNRETKIFSPFRRRSKRYFEKDLKGR
jgi:outer membrane cobalamin receptor